MSSIIGMALIFGISHIAQAFPAPVMSFYSRVPGQYKAYTIYLHDWRNRHTFPTLTNVRPEAYAWSPDGRKIAVSELGERGITFTIYDVLTGEAILPPHHGLFPAWSPNGQQVAFVRPTAYGNDTDSDVVILTLSTDTEMNITNSRDIDEKFPFWSADGEAVIYLARRDDETSQWQRTALATNTTMPVPLITGAVISPDGQWMARISSAAWSADTSTLQIFSRDGQLVRAITLDTIEDISWSPDSRYLAIAQTFPVGFKGLKSFPIQMYDRQTDSLFPVLGNFRGQRTLAGAAWTAEGQLSMLTVNDSTGARAWAMLSMDTKAVQIQPIPAGFSPDNMQWQPN